MRFRGSILGIGTALLLAAPAEGATKLGETFDPTAALGGPATLVQANYPAGTSYIVPAGGGVITSWSYDGPPSGTVPQMRLKLLRGTADPAEFTVVAQSELEQPTIGPVSTFTTRIPVTGGERLGLGATGPSAPVRTAGGFVTRIASTDVGVGTTAAFPLNSPATQLDVSAQLEPDADGDGFGDETQDGCPTDAAVQGPCPDVAAPETTITKAPKKVKTKKRKATLRIEFEASEPSTFKCALDGRTTTCTSPYVGKARRGKHLFTVVATDTAGNIDATPAKATIKVKRKKKR